jgi:5-methylthioadenosine/S-adenosylhomocysteine deaminase
VDARGRIAALGPDAVVPHPQGTPAFRYPDGVLLPGFVNAHTHLELTGLRGSVPDPDFYRWIQHIRRAKDETSAESYLAWAREGVQEAWRHGTTVVADTGTSGAVARALTELGGAGIAYHEAIHPDPARAEATMAAARDMVARLRRDAGPRVVIGISPHAPYTVSRTLYVQVASYARAEGLPLAGHVAESAAETELVRDAAGPFAELWSRRGIPPDPPAASPVRLLADLGVLGPDFLAIHAVQADATDVEVLAAANAAVVVCPRSNARHGHGSAPLGRYLERGLRVALGTDSLASVDSLDLLEEAREARVRAGLSADEAIRLLTLDGARALGLEKETGSLEPGKWADLVVVRPAPLPSDPPTLPPYRLTALPPSLAAEAVLLARPEAVLATFVAGHPVYQAHSGGAASP